MGHKNGILWDGKYMLGKQSSLQEGLLPGLHIFYSQYSNQIID